MGAKVVDVKLQVVQMLDAYVMKCDGVVTDTVNALEKPAVTDIVYALEKPQSLILSMPWKNPQSLK